MNPAAQKWLFRTIVMLAAVALAAGRGFGAEFASDDWQSVRRETERLAAVSSRMVGEPGHDQIISQLLHEIRELPGVRVWEHRFPVVMPRVRKATLTVTEGPLADTHRIYPLWPAGTRLNTTPAAGLASELIYIGRGRSEEVPPKSMRGRIAVMELSGRDGWQRAARSGAAAILLLDDGTAVQGDVASHFVPIPINMPRFYVPEGPLADALRRNEIGSARIDSVCRFERVEATNLYILVDPLPPSPPRRALALAAQIDASSLTPELAPGADAAVDAATLLVALRHFAHNQPAQPLLFALLDGQSINQLGVRHMAGALALPPSERWKALSEDSKVLEEYERALALARQLEATGDVLANLPQPAYRELHRMVRDEVDQDVTVIESQLQTLRLRKAEVPGEALAALDVGIVELTRDRDRLRAAQRAMVSPRPLSDELRPLAERLWQRAFRRIVDQHTQTQEVVAEVVEGQRIRREICAALGLPAEQGDERPVAFLLGLDLSDAGVAVGPARFCNFQCADETYNGRALREWLMQSAGGAKKLAWREELRPYVNVKPLTSTAWNTAHIVGRLPTVTSPIQAFGLPGITWATLEGDRLRADTPSDRFDRLDWSRLRPQVQATLKLIELLASDATFAATADTTHPKWSRIGGAVLDSAPGEPIARLPMAGYVTHLVPGISGSEQCVPSIRSSHVPGVRREEFLLSGADGRFRFDLLPSRMANWTKLHLVYLQASQLADDGSIVRAVDYRRMGRGSLLNFDMTTAPKKMSLRAVPFTCREISAHGLIDARFVMPLESGTLLDARSMSAPKRSNISFFNGMMSAQVEPGLSWLLILRAGITRNRMVLLNMDKPEPSTEASARELIRGFELGLPLPHDPAYQSGLDWYRLDGLRLEQYRKAGITSQAIEQIRERTDELLQEAAAALDSDDGATFHRTAGAAMANESAAYQAALNTADDTIRGAVFLLLMLVPFAFAMERLLIAGSSIYRQVLWSMAIFALMCAVLWSFHPAFRISSQPLTVIMAFAIICLAALVTVMVYGKFSSELEKMRSGRAEESGARTSRFGVLTTAVRLGIANMRKRRLRTALTGLTVVLITFALLCFVSTSRYVDFSHYSLDRPSQFTGVLLRNAGSRPMPREALAEISAAVAPEHSVVPRYWWVQSNAIWRLQVYNEAHDRQVEFSGALGLSPEEADLTAVAKVCPDWDRFSAEGGCYMAAERAAALGVRPGDNIIVAGQTVKLIGVFASAEFDRLVLDIDGKALTPADYSDVSAEEVADINNTTLARMAHDELSGAGAIADISLTTLTSDNVLVVSSDILCRQVDGAQLRSVAIKAAGADEAGRIARLLAGRYAFVTAYGAIGETAGVLARMPLVPSAPRSLIVPLLIGGLIIFNTMLSSLAERRREIYVYTSLGLAPMHVAFLFLAEAMTYGLMGTVFGYVVGQGAASAMSSLGWLGDITLNYSGTQAIMIMLLVLAVVMVSSLVPAYLAGRLAAPSNVRKWEVPAPQGGVIRDALPFTVTHRTAAGVMFFLREFFDAHREGVIGDFSSDNIRLLPPDGDLPGFGLAATVWLAPYDLGLRQDVRLTIEPGEQPDIYRTCVTIRRGSGSATAWRKLNRTFLSSLRRQLLGWRNLSTERVLDYIAQGEKLRDELTAHSAAVTRGGAVATGPLGGPAAAVAAEEP